MEEITEQEIFNKVWLGMKSQDFQKSMHPIYGDLCAYRGEFVRKCAVGHLLSDEEYLPEMEGKSVEVLLEEGLLPERWIPWVRMLKLLQQAHDNWGSNGKNSLIRFAQKNNLTIPDWVLECPM